MAHKLEQILLAVFCLFVNGQNPDVLSPVGEYHGPQANRLSPDVFEVCVPQMFLLSDIRTQVALWINTTRPTLTARFYYSGVQEVTDNLFLGTVCKDLIHAYEYAFTALVDQDLVLPLDGFATRFAILNGFNPFTDVIAQFAYAARIVKRGETSAKWYFSLDRVQNLAMAGNVTTIRLLGEKVPPPVNNSYGWSVPFGNSWNWNVAVRLINRMFDELHIEEPFQNEVCEFSTTMEAIALSVGSFLINTDGSCGYDDPKFQAAIETILLPIIEGKPHMVARWMYMNDSIVQQFMMESPELWPSSRPLPMPLGTCLISNQVQGLAVISSGGGPALQRFRSPDKANVMQTWGWGISTKTNDPDRVWDFIAFTINCNNPVWKTYLLNTNKIPNFKHCFNPDLDPTRDFNNKIAASSTMQNSLAERDKSFPLTYPGSPPANTQMIETLSLHLRFLGRLIQGAMPDINWYGWRVPPYSEIPSRWGKGIRHALPAGYNRSGVAKTAIAEACSMLAFLQLPVCDMRHVQFFIEKCENEQAFAQPQFNPEMLNKTCIGTAFANFTLKKISAILTDCPFVTIDSTIGTISVALASVVTLIVLAMYGVLYKHFQAFIFRVSSRYISLVFLGGILILTWSPTMFLLSCTASLWMLTNGLFVAVGAMWVKVWRLFRMLLAGNKLVTVYIPDRHLMLILLGIVLANNVVFVGWFFTRGENVVPVPVPQVAGTQQIVAVMQCNMGGIWAYLVWLFMLAGLLTTSAYMAWRMSKYAGADHKDNLANAAKDSKALLAIAFTMLVFVAAAAFTLTAASSWKAMVILQLGMVTTVCCLMVVVYFLPRLLQLAFDPNATKSGTFGPNAQQDKDPSSSKKERKLLETGGRPDGHPPDPTTPALKSAIEINVHTGLHTSLQTSSAAATLHPSTMEAWGP